MAYRTLLLRDPQRRPADWHEHLGEGQWAVFLSDVRSGRAVTILGTPPASGEAASCLVFDSFEEANDFCRERVGLIEHLRCDIYDHRGLAVSPLAQWVNPRSARRLPTARSAAWMRVGGCVLILISPLLFWWDSLRGGMLVVPTLLGLNCIIGALRLFYLAHSMSASIKRTRHEKVLPSDR